MSTLDFGKRPHAFVSGNEAKRTVANPGQVSKKRGKSGRNFPTLRSKDLELSSSSERFHQSDGWKSGVIRLTVMRTAVESDAIKSLARGNLTTAILFGAYGGT